MINLRTSSFNIFKLSFLLLLLSPAPSIVSGECTCDGETTEKNKGEALKYKIALIATILFTGAVGVSIPLLGRRIPALRPEQIGSSCSSLGFVRAAPPPVAGGEPRCSHGLDQWLQHGGWTSHGSGPHYFKK
ncbi:hypothetical protein FH972_010189 [Carpinus fangiana]|uniref:Uncharacterized protein n=1 Tax=Carpinus fangiana TaxID=176857 RepID=A0A660KP60_9ROSI|nr:hypothetical protein FH972_010189 [Carpinus fangiana]